MDRATTNRWHGFACRGAVCALLAVFLPSAYAQLDAPESTSRGAYSVAYQYIREGNVVHNAGSTDIGSSETQVLLFDVELSLNDKWSFFGNLPLVYKRYNGDSPHDPHSLEEHVDERFIDDGSYHGGFQDLAFQFRYLLPISSVQVQPYIGAGFPTSDYPIFAHAAIGQNLKRVDVGTLITYLPPFSSFYYRFSLGKAFVESVQGVNVDFWRFDGEIGYFVNPRLALRGYFLTRTGNGLEFPDDFPLPRNDLHWYEHEGFLAREYAIVGFGADWALNDRNRLAFSVLRSAHARFIHETDYGVTLGITRGF